MGLVFYVFTLQASEAQEKHTKNYKGKFRISDILPKFAAVALYSLIERSYAFVHRLTFLDR